MAAGVRNACWTSDDGWPQVNREGMHREGDYRWVIEPTGAMRVPAVLYADEQLLDDMDDKVRWQLCNVASLPGIVGAAYAMPDAHWGYGFPIGGVAAFDADAGGVVSAGGVGFDISCGVRTLVSTCTREDVLGVQERLAHELHDVTIHQRRPPRRCFLKMDLAATRLIRKVSTNRMMPMPNRT